MKDNLRKSSLLLFCAMFFVFAFFASPGLAYIVGPISADGTGTIKTYTSSLDLDVQTTGDTSKDFSPDHRGVVAVNGGSVDITKELKVTTTGDNSDALNALSGGKIKAGSADITTSGNTAVAVYAQSAAAISSVDITGHAKITTNGKANGVYANENGEISFGSLDVTTNNENSVALQANGNGTNKGGVIKVSDYATVTTSGKNANGLVAMNGGNISIGGLATVTTSGDEANGIYLRQRESSISVGSANISTDGEEANGIDMSFGTVSVANAAVIATSGASADSLYVYSGTFKAGSLQVQTQGNNALGIHSTGGGASVDITGLAKVTTSGDWSDGMSATGGGVITAGSADVTTKGAHSYGIYSSSTSDDLRSTVDITGLAKVTTASKDSYGMWAAEKGVIKVDSAEISTSGENGLGIASSKLASVDITGLAKVTTFGQNGQGLRAEDGGAITAGSADVTTSGSGAHGILSWGVSDDQRASVNITGLANVSTRGSGAYGLYAQDGGAITAGSADVTTRGSGAYGIWSSGVSGKYSSSVDIKGQAKVLTLGSTQYGLYAESGDITVGGLADVRVANGSNAVYAKNGIIKLNGGASLDVTGDGTGSNYVNGIGAASNGNVFVSGDKAVIKATANGSNGNAYAVYTDGGSVSVDVTGNIEFTASAQNGSASAVNGSNITLKASGQASFDVTGLSASGLYKNSGQNLTVDAVGGSNYKVTATSGDAYGIEAAGASLDYGKVNNVTVNATNGNANGLAAMNSGALGSDTAMNGAISATAKGSNYVIANAVYASDISSVKLSGATGISAVGANAADAENESDAYAVNAVSSSDVEIAMNGDMKASGSGTTAYADGLFANYSKVSASGVKNLIVSATGTAGDESAWGVDATGGSDVALAMGGDMKVSSTGNAYGVDAYSDSTVSLSGAMAISVTADSGDAYGINAYDRSAVSADAGSLTAVSNKGAAYGINLYTDHVSSIDVTGDLTVRSAAGGTGITAAGAAHQITVGGLADVAIAAGGGNAIYAADGANVNLNGSVSIDVTGTDEVSGIRAESGGKITVSGDKAAEIAVKSTGGNAYGILVSGDQASVKFNKINNITVNSAGSGYGLYANSSTDVSGTINNITVSASGASGDAYGIYAPDKSTSLDVKVTGKIKAVSETGDAFSIYSKAGIIATEANDASISGDVKAENGSQQAINMTSSDLTGAVNATGGATVDLSLDAKSVWNVTGASSTNGELAVNGGTVNFLQTGANSDDVNKYRRVAVKTLSGQGGVFKMHADIESGKGDQIVADNSNVKGVIEIISPKKFGPYRKRMSDDLVIVNNDKNSSFTLSSDVGYYEYGSWKFVLASEDIDGAALAGTSGLATLAANGGGLGWYLLNTQQVSSTATAVFDSLMAPTIGHLEEGALYSQLGDQDWIASGDRTHVWGYAVYSKFKYTGHVTTPLEGSIDGDNYAENKYYGLTGGIDKVVHECDKGTLRLGAMMGYGEGDLDMDNGDASDNSFHAGVYGIYRFNSGLYLAGIAKYNRYRTDVTARPIEGGSYEASYNQDGFGISALAGKRFDLRNSWYVEPQAELGWARIGSASYTINNSDVEIDSTNSVRGRLGFSLGRRVATETGKTLDFYVKASVIREFDGETDLTMSGDPFKADFGGTWGQYKLGVNYWNNDNFMLHGALVYENGESYESPIGIELGLNWFTGPKPQKDEAETTITE